MNDKLIFSGIGLGWGRLETELMKYHYQHINKFNIKISTHYGSSVYKSNQIFNDIELPEILSVLHKHNYQFRIKSRKSKQHPSIVYKYLKIKNRESQSALTPHSLLIAKINFLLQCALNDKRKHVTLPSNKKISNLVKKAIDEFNTRKLSVSTEKIFKKIRSVESRVLYLHVEDILKPNSQLLKVYWD